MFLKDFSFNLPKELIATKPVYPRDSSKLLVLKKFKLYEETLFSNLSNHLKEGDLVVLNNTKVNTSKINGTKINHNTSVEFTFISNINKGLWSCFALPGKKVKVGDIFNFIEVEGTIIRKDSETIYIDFKENNLKFIKILNENGKISLPPYISKVRELNEDDNTSYQTIYSEVNGSIAAPTAGLHFTDKVFEDLKRMNIGIEKITLSIGPGTFLPLRKNKINDNKLHSEKILISDDIAKRLNDAYLDKNRRIISIGTTTLRALESSFDKKNLFKPYDDYSDIFIYPGKRIYSIDGLVTNFHLPESSLFILICSLIGTKTALEMYKYAIKKQFRFYSYGDACFLLNQDYD